MNKLEGLWQEFIVAQNKSDEWLFFPIWAGERGWFCHKTPPASGGLIHVEAHAPDGELFVADLSLTREQLAEFEAKVDREMALTVIVVMDLAEHSSPRVYRNSETGEVF